METLRRSVRTHLGVFGIIFLGTLIAVGASYLDFAVSGKVAIALTIAVIQACLVGGYFMHLFAEKRSIYAVLTFTAVFFAVLMVLTIWATYDRPAHSVTPHTQPSLPHVP